MRRYCRLKSLGLFTFGLTLILTIYIFVIDFGTFYEAARLKKQPLFQWKTNSQVTVTHRQRPSNDSETPKKSYPIKDTYILWTRWRSGSSFLGSLLSQARPNTFYSFEPLHAFGLAVRKEKTQETTLALRFLDDLIHCKYVGYEYLVDYFVKNEFYFTYNPLTRELCKDLSSCNSTKLLSQLCQNSSLQIIKVLRLSLMWAEYFLTKYPELKIIYLIRDPRGTLKSRSRLLWCLLKDCHDPKRVCELMEEDLDYSYMLLRKFPERFIFVRYEDLAMRPKEIFSDIWVKLGQIYDEQTDYIIRNYTLIDQEKGTFALRKNSKRNAFAWRASLDYKSMMKIQKSCSPQLAKIGYKEFDTEEQYDNIDFSSMLPGLLPPFLSELIQKNKLNSILPQL